jgi:hypothetical protein
VRKGCLQEVHKFPVGGSADNSFPVVDTVMFVKASYFKEYFETCRSRKSRIWPCGSAELTMHTLYQQKLALTSPKSGGRSAGIVRSRTKATGFV